VIKQREAEFLQGAGRFEEAKKALDDKEKILSAMQTRINQSRTTEAGIAERQFTGDVQIFEGAQNREANQKLEEYRRQTQLMLPKEQDMVSRLEALKLSEITGGKPETATVKQKIEAAEYGLNAVKGAGRTEGIAAQNTRTAMKALADWEEKTGGRLRMMNPKTPKVYEDAKKEEIARIKQVLGVDLSVSPAGAATTTKSGATVSNWN
jgi:hypothetical protein